MSYGLALVNKTRELSVMKIDIVSNKAIYFTFTPMNEEMRQKIETYLSCILPTEIAEWPVSVLYYYLQDSETWARWPSKMKKNLKYEGDIIILKHHSIFFLHKSNVRE